MKDLQLLMIVVLLFSCQTEQKSNLDSTEYSSTRQFTESQMDSVERESYYGYDTLELFQYVSKFGHLIQVQGSKSGGIYRIKVKTKEHRSKVFEIADNSYTANHAQIVWDNDEFIFIRTACGTECWQAIVLSLQGKMEQKKYSNYLFDDSLSSHILYMSDTERNSLIFKDLSTEKQDSQSLDVCTQSTFLLFAIDTVIHKAPNILDVVYKGKDCNSRKTRTFRLE